MSRVKPLNQSSEGSLAANKKLLEFLDMMNVHGMFEKGIIEGKIVFADELVLNHRTMETQMKQLGKHYNLMLCKNGLETIEYFDKMLSDVASKGPNTFEESCQQPVSLLLIDINISKYTGMEVLKIVKEKYEQINAKFPCPDKQASVNNLVSSNG